MDDRELVNVLDGYITARNQLRKEQAFTKPKPQKFYMDFFAGHASRLGEVLPILSIVQLEGLSELTNSLLNERKMTQ